MAWLVHALTASGALIAYIALTNVIKGNLKVAFLWLAVATVIDSIDGVLARLARVKERAPMLNGARLDDIVDYLTFVFVPAVAIQHAGLLPDGLTTSLVVAAMLISSAFGFSRDDAKTADHFFTGFPSYWNIVAVYMVALRLPPAVNAAILLLLAASRLRADRLRLPVADGAIETPDRGVRRGVGRDAGGDHLAAARPATMVDPDFARLSGLLRRAVAHAPALTKGLRVIGS